jgi:hypothetical protein
MAWNIATGTIDLGLTFFDAIFVVKDWIRDFIKHRGRQAKKVEMFRRGKRPQRRSLQWTVIDN